jgi:hypothetical protein
MSIFDDPHVHLRVDGIEVDPQELAEEVRSDGLSLPSDRISWPIVDRWCRDHPGKVRLLPARHVQTTTYLRKRFPHLTVRGVRTRPRSATASPTTSKVCDILVSFVPEGVESPFKDGVPGLPYRVTKTTAERDAPRT